MSSFYADKIAAKVKKKYTDVKVCLDGELIEERRALTDRMRREETQSAFGNTLASKLQGVLTRIADATITVRIYAVSANRWVEAVIANPYAEDPEQRYPGDTEQGCSVVGLTLDLLPESARVVDGDTLQQLTPDEWDDIGNQVDFGEYAQLVNGVIHVNTTNALINRFQEVDEHTAGKA